MHPVTQQAMAAMGEERPTDWQLRPETHAESLPPEAEPLKRVLGDPGFGEIIATYRKADEASRRAQRFYKGLARLSAWTGFGAALVGCLVLMLLPLLADGSPLAATAAVTQGVLLLVSLGASLAIGSLEPFRTWMLNRAEAENARLDLFDRVLADTQPGMPGALPLLPLQLEYFRRYQLDVQRVYYHERGAQHASAAHAAWWWRLGAFMLIVAALFPLVWSIQDAVWLPGFVTDAAARVPAKTEIAQRVFLGLGIIAAALQGLLASFAVMSLDERNAARYRATAANLDALAGRPLEEARSAAATAGDEATREARDRVLAFVALVHDQISSEHREWIALRKVAPDLALDRLKSLRLPPRA